MQLLNKIYKVLPVLATLLLGGCGSTNPNSPTNFNTNVAPTAVQAAVLCPSTNPAFAGGDGSVGNPYQISQFCHFYAYSANPAYWAMHTQMTADIDNVPSACSSETDASPSTSRHMTIRRHGCANDLSKVDAAFAWRVMTCISGRTAEERVMSIDLLFSRH